MSISLDDIIVNNYDKAINCFKTETDESGKQIFICQIDGCALKYNTNSASIRHVRLNHQLVHKTIQMNKTKGSSDDDSPFNKLFEIRVKVNPEEIWNACVDLITINALPLCAVEYPAFKKNLQPYVISLKRQGIDLIINRKNIREKIDKKAKEIKNLITLEANNKMVCLMLDIASRYNRSVLGVNISYFYNGKIRIRTIGMHVLHFTYTAINLKDKVTENLLNFKIRLEQMIAVTTDNGKNLVKLITCLNSDVQNTQVFEADSEDDEYIDHDIFDGDYYESLLAEVQSMFEEINQTNLIHGISCGVHCLHLVVTHSIKKSKETHDLIEKCRNLAKKLRSPTFRAMLKAKGLSSAIIDVATRWNSIFSMVNLNCMSDIFLYFNLFIFFS